MEKKANSIAFLTEDIAFPPVDNATAEGLVAVGGDLAPKRLIEAYKSGIFPWFNEDSLILWWSPDPRMVLFPDQLKISKSMRKVLRENAFQLTKNKAFEEVIDSCATATRKNQEGTWITRDMKSAYKELHSQGLANSYEVWKEDELVGGLYGVDLGHVFCGESMFSKTANASKFGLIQMVVELQKEQYKLIDCQVYTEHLKSLGAEEIPRSEYLKILKRKNH